jgi:hypothetical protein
MAYREHPFGAACGCGHRRQHPFVGAEAEYSAVGWALLILGITPRPRRVVIRCRRCDFVFGETVDPRVLMEHD